MKWISLLLFVSLLFVVVGFVSCDDGGGGGGQGAPGSGAPAPAPVPQTGQTKCWNIDGGEIPCAGTGQDGDIQAGVKWPDPRFTDNEDGTIRDNLTGIIWLKDANCFASRTWAQALVDANALAEPACGLSDGSSPGDWHLPNLRELTSLVDYGNTNPALPTGRPFVNVQSDYWSSTTFAVDPSLAFSFAFSEGAVVTFGKKANQFVLPVRGGATGGTPAPVPQTGQTTCWDSDGKKIACAGTGQDGDLQAGVKWPDPRFTDDLNGTITDNLTGLIWLRNANCFGGRTWAQALTDANTLSAGKCGLRDESSEGAWRLPNVLEFMSIVDLDSFKPVLPFMNLQSSDYWTSTTAAGEPDGAMGVNFNFPTFFQPVLPVGKIAPFPVLPVRDGS